MLISFNGSSLINARFSLPALHLTYLGEWGWLIIFSHKLSLWVAFPSLCLTVFFLACPWELQILTLFCRAIQLSIPCSISQKVIEGSLLVTRSLSVASKKCDRFRRKSNAIILCTDNLKIWNVRLFVIYIEFLTFLVL